MIGPFLYRMINIPIGFLIPVFRSFKAIKTGEEDPQIDWLMYWIMMALFTSSEFILDLILDWFPLYYEFKLGFVVWLSMYRGSLTLYENFLHHYLVSHEDTIDHGLDTIKTKTSRQLTTAGSALVRHARAQSTMVIKAVTESFMVDSQTLDGTIPRNPDHDLGYENDHGGEYGRNEVDGDGEDVDGVKEASADANINDSNGKSNSRGIGKAFWHAVEEYWPSKGGGDGERDGGVSSPDPDYVKIPAGTGTSDGDTGKSLGSAAVGDASTSGSGSGKAREDRQRRLEQIGMEGIARRNRLRERKKNP